MIAQYRRLKQAHAGALLFFRMGDFYEMFFEDAVAAAPALDIALTKRGRHAGQDIPMCGVPVHNAEPYLHRLIKKGFRVAICEQVEDPAEARKRPGRSLVQREVIRIVTPGTLTEDSLLDSRANNYLAAVAESRQALGLAWLDLSTGTFLTEPIGQDQLAGALARIAPSELLLSERLRGAPALAELWREWDPQLTVLAPSLFDSTAGEKRLAEAFGLVAVEALGSFGRAELAAAGALVDYVRATQKNAAARLERPRRLEPSSLMRIDPATRRNLELLSSLAGTREGSLLAAVDRTVTGAGGRLLAERIAAPLAEPLAIRRRQDQLAACLDDPDLRAGIRRLLGETPDLQRPLARLSLGRAGPRDLVSLGQGLERAEALRRLAGADERLRDLADAIDPPPALASRLQGTLVPDPPALARDGGFIRPGTSPALDELRALRDQGRRHIAALETRLKGETGIATLKIRHNNQLGFYIEVAAQHRAKVPAGFVQRQSMADAVRFLTPELDELQSRIASAADQALQLELDLLQQLQALVLAAAEPIQRTAVALAELDVAAGLAELAASERHVRPVILAEPVLEIRGGRHPVVEQFLRQTGQPFVANDCTLGEAERLWLLTGPNMAGKSTYLRQNALIAILAQIGAHVPATSARIGIVDRLFSRVGAADDLARGRSTFMVEMVETATILNQAGPQSLVILDEIGRGTATYDGLSLAWAVVEHLHEVNRCRGLFATHYHELTALAARLPAMACHTMRVKEWQGEVVFLHEVGKGTADRSYGIHVARLAGLPEPVLRRAAEVLHRLEQGESGTAASRLADDLPLFRAAIEVATATSRPEARPSPVLDELARCNPDELTPKAALDLLYRLRGLL